VVERAAALGEAVDESTRLFAVADTTTMWVFIDVPEAHAHVVRHGHRVELRVAGLDLDGVTGGVDWVSPRVDRQTRTVAARAEVANPDGMLRDGMFATAVVTLRPPEERVIVPKTAVQWEGCCNVVFVRRTDAVFEPRKVRLGFEWEGAYVVEDGLRGGETVVTTGSFLLKTELVKGSIGAGCCEVLPGSE
jgi:cobalt-zinc-cadmium efflux system membrane fusion protein